MKIRFALSAGFLSLTGDKMRSLLTMLGIVIGTASVLAMIAIGDGAKRIVRREVEKFGGANQFTLLRYGMVRRGNRWLKNRSGEFLVYEDVLDILAECPSVKAVIPRIPRWRGMLVQAAGLAEKRTGYNGVDFDFPNAMDWTVKAGRFFSEDEFFSRRTFCVLGAEVAKELFGERSPIGLEIKMTKESEWGRRKGERRK